MKFKIIDIKDVNGSLQIGIKHKYCEREVFGIPPEHVDNPVEFIKDILKKRNYQKIKIDKTLIGKEITI